jgi:hypothetical protein
VSISGPGGGAPAGMKCKQTRVLESNNITDILNDLGFLLKAVDTTPESAATFKLLMKLCSNALG